MIQHPVAVFTILVLTVSTQVWSVSRRQSTLRMRVESAARALAYSPSGTHLAVGLGGDRDAMVKEGAVLVLAGDNLEILDEASVICVPNVRVRSGSDIVS